MRSRQAWVRVFATALGVDVSACHDNPTTPPNAEPSQRPITAAAPVASDSSVTPPLAVEASAPLASSAPDSSFADGKLAPLAMIDAGGGIVTSRPTPGLRNICGVVVRPDDYTDPVRSLVGDVQYGAVTGGSTTDERVLAGVRPRIKNCVTRALASDPSIRGKVTLTIKVAANGDIDSVNASNATGLPQALIDCTTSQVKRASFDAAPARTLVVTVSMQQKATPSSSEAQ